MNKVDKIFVITLIILPIMITMPILAFLFLYKIMMTNPPNNIGYFVYFLFKLNCIALPACSLILLYTFYKKILVKNKTFNTWIMIILNLIFAIIYSVISYLWIMIIIVSDGINS